MQLKFRRFSILFFILISTLAFSQEQALKSIVQEDLKRHMQLISSDELQGRRIGMGDGLEKAAQYIEKHARENGLLPVNGVYSQEVDISLVSPVNSNSTIKATNTKRNETFKTPVICLNNRMINLDLKGNVVFAGFGTTNESLEYNDYKGLDVNGKIVLVSSGDLVSFNENENYQWNDRFESKKPRLAFENGAEAVIVVTNPNDRKNNIFSQLGKFTNREIFTLKAENVEQEEKVFITTPEFADFILGGKNRYQEYLASIVKMQKPNSFVPKNDEIEIHFQKKVESYPSRNIFGVVEGSDPVLKDEYVVYMAHYDHLGIDDEGEIFNGADDNGTGVTVLLELAEAFSGMEAKPKRSILFLWVTGEELGMFGSRYYSENPVIPIGKTVACINLDMIGRVYEPRDSVWKRSPKLVKDFDGLFTLTNSVWPGLNQISDSVCNKLGLIPDNSLPANFLSSSDHYYFHKNGVPVLNVSTGYHADYHKITDEISKINFDKMKRVADYCFLVGYKVANTDKFRNKNAQAN